jgi:transcriptional regulator with XRE-family HTH domain
MTTPNPRPRSWRTRDYEHTMRTLDSIRADQDVTYVALAEKIGVGARELSEWLRCKRMTNARRVNQIAAGLGYDLALVPREDA